MTVSRLSRNLATDLVEFASSLLTAKTSERSDRRNSSPFRAEATTCLSLWLNDFDAKREKTAQVSVLTRDFQFVFVRSESS